MKRASARRTVRDHEREEDCKNSAFNSQASDDSAWEEISAASAVDDSDMDCSPTESNQEADTDPLTGALVGDYSERVHAGFAADKCLSQCFMGKAVQLSCFFRSLDQMNAGERRRVS